jgi:hypothetical protein
MLNGAIVHNGGSDQRWCRWCPRHPRSILLAKDGMCAGIKDMARHRVMILENTAAVNVRERRWPRPPVPPPCCATGRVRPTPGNGSSGDAETALVCDDRPRVLRILARTATNLVALARHPRGAPKAGAPREADPCAMSSRRLAEPDPRPTPLRQRGPRAARLWTKALPEYSYLRYCG